MEFNAAHVHLLLNHVPILGAVTAALLLTLAMFFRREALTRVSLWMLAVAGIVAVPVYLSGEEAEDIVEDLGAAHAVIEPHEEAALVTVVALGALALISLGVLWWFGSRPKLPRWVTGAMWLLAVGGAFLAGRTAYLGGQIRHTEIRPPEVRQQLESARPGEAQPSEAAASSAASSSSSSASSAASASAASASSV